MQKSLILKPCISIVITDHKIIVAKNQTIDQAVLLRMIILIILLDLDIFTLYMISFFTCFIKSAWWRQRDFAPALLQICFSIVAILLHYNLF